jgi:hypothetical protein
MRYGGVGRGLPQTVRPYSRKYVALAMGFSSLNISLQSRDFFGLDQSNGLYSINLKIMENVILLFIETC